MLASIAPDVTPLSHTSNEQEPDPVIYPHIAHPGSCTTYQSPHQRQEASQALARPEPGGGR